MKQIAHAVSIAIVLCLYADAQINPRDITNPATPVSRGIDYNVNLNDSSSVPIVDKFNEYLLQTNILSKFRYVETKYRQRIFFEAHLGVGTFVRSGESSENFYFGFKFNLFNPKIVTPRSLLADIHEVQELNTIREFTFSSYITEKCTAMEKDLETYLKSVWWKRLSLGIMFPIVKPDYLVNSSGMILSTSTSSYTTFLYKNTTLFLGYDIADLITIQIGASINKSFYAGLSVDVSTPVYVAASRFFTMLRDFSKIRNLRY